VWRLVELVGGLALVPILSLCLSRCCFVVFFCVLHPGLNFIPENCAVYWFVCGQTNCGWMLCNVPELQPSLSLAWPFQALHPFPVSWRFVRVCVGALVDSATDLLLCVCCLCVNSGPVSVPLIFVRFGDPVVVKPSGLDHRTETK